MTLKLALKKVTATPIQVIVKFRRLRAWHLSVIILTLLIMFTIHPFLAINKPVDGEILVVEGWLPNYALRAAIDEFNKGDYRYLVTTGGPLPNSSKFSGYSNYAEFSAKKLKDLGFDENLLIAVPAPRVKRNHSYSFAVAFREWLLHSNLDIKAVNVFTLGAHARKSYVLYSKVLRPNLRVGVIAAKPRGYDPKFWWSSVEGIKWVLQDAIGYIYAMIWSF